MDNRERVTSELPHIDLPVPYGFTQVGEYLLLDPAYVAVLRPADRMYELLLTLAEAKLAGVMQQTYVVDYVSAALLIGDDGVRFILDRNNWRKP